MRRHPCGSRPPSMRHIPCLGTTHPHVHHDPPPPPWLGGSGVAWPLLRWCMHHVLLLGLALGSEACRRPSELLSDLFSAVLRVLVCVLCRPVRFPRVECTTPKEKSHTRPRNHTRNKRDEEREGERDRAAREEKATHTRTTTHGIDQGRAHGNHADTRINRGTGLHTERTPRGALSRLPKMALIFPGTKPLPLILYNVRVFHVALRTETELRPAAQVHPAPLGSWEETGMSSHEKRGS